jgi:hypothetical protein
MSPERTLHQLLRLRAAMDAALSYAVPVGDEDVRVLVGLLDALDHALRAGGPLPARWSAAHPTLALAPRGRSVTIPPHPTPANDNGSRRRHPRVRGRLSSGQLALPWTSAGPVTAR